MTFTYAGPLATAVFVTGAFNDAQANAKANSIASGVNFDAADALTTSLPQVPTSDNLSLAGYDVLATRLASAKAADDRALAEFQAGIGNRDTYSSTVNGPLRAFQDKLTADITTFYNTYFPNATLAMTRALQQMQDAIRYGRTTIKRSVSNLKWQAEVDKILRQKAMDEEKLLDTYAAKRFAAPPGALFKKIADMQEEAQRAIARASNDVYTKNFDQELEATKSYIDKALVYRNEAMDSFGEYMKDMVVLRYDELTMEAGEQDAYRRKLKDVFFTDRMAEKTAEEWTRKLKTTTFGLDMASDQATDEYVIKQVQVQLEAAIAAAERLSTIAATAFNIVRGGAVISSNES